MNYSFNNELLYEMVLYNFFFKITILEAKEIGGRGKCNNFFQLFDPLLKIESRYFCKTN